MKLGVSTYCLYQAMGQQKMDIFAVLKWIKDNGGEHAEIVQLLDIGFDLHGKPELADQIKQYADEIGLELSNYCVGGNVAGLSEEAYRAEIDHIKGHVDIAQRLGVKRMRHDIASRPLEETGTAYFEQDYAQIVTACREIAEYASQYGITTSIENHGFYAQHSERVRRIVLDVNRDNFRTTLDVGNFVCVDEPTEPAVRANVSLASMVHFKDFYLRPADCNPGEGWFQSLHGQYIRGAIVGQGDLPMPKLVSIVKQSGYDGYVSIEFEGMEDCLKGTRIALDNLRRLWDEA
ncbi:sugar phosphate isomerase/epimerase [Paenibacillus sp. SC116]|uniref:sugar phosphate isomerase/epimerase family protein n=1 Tax=Paenibacillus sp. SC116 TaxID=2968986 RepID=UPI00215A9620|nr:sugar phosphate isomerase/epimerase family protein [Paenibacillus sp. SC116]MCR8843945.1 sugar phosphate isomerase/epimerase [Paenibacillus sp. SC116]